MSSSSALIVSVYLALAALGKVHRFPSYLSNLQKPADLASYLGAVENGYSYKKLVGKQGAGTRGGAQDHTAILYSEKGKFGHFGYRPLRRLDSVEMPARTSFVIGSSGVRSRKGSSELSLYNNAVEIAEMGLDSWNHAMKSDFPTLGMLVSAPGFSLEKLTGILESRLEGESRAIINRVEQFMIETTKIIPDAIAALRNGDMGGFGDAVFQSQELTDRLLGNQVDETRFLARAAREHGALASSAFGAGFGGSVWALVPARESITFMKQWIAAYGRAFPHRIREAQFFIDSTGPGAFILGASARDLLLEPQL